jgi:hypothetical protein
MKRYDARCTHCRADRDHDASEHQAAVTEGKALLLKRMDTAIANLRNQINVR